MPAGRPLLVLAHDPDRLETDCAVTGYRYCVVGGGIDHQAVMTEIDCQVAHQRAYRVLSDAAAVYRRIEEDVDRRVPVHRVGFFAVLDETDCRGVQFDNQTGLFRVAERPVHVGVLVTPPRMHLGGVQYSA